MSYYGFDNSYMLDLIWRRPRTFRGIAVIDAGSSDLEGQMKRLASAGVRGFRIHADAPQDGWAEQPGLHKMFQHAARHRLAICPLINPESLPQLDTLCARFRDTPVIVDHIARIGASGPIRDSDVTALCSLARWPETKVKLSAFYALGAKRPPHLDLAAVDQARL
jgi:predicted TIM-barrel fold metal-dependent hydrolase